MKAHLKNVYTNKLENLREMIKFLHPSNLPKLNQCDINNLNSSTKSNRINTIQKINLSTNNNPCTDVIHYRILPILQRIINTNPS